MITQPDISSDQKAALSLNVWVKDGKEWMLFPEYRLIIRKELKGMNKVTLCWALIEPGLEFGVGLGGYFRGDAVLYCLINKNQGRQIIRESQ